jgi:tellurite methyltransferase
VLKKIRASDEVFSTLSIETYDIEAATIENDYDLIISTVVLQFLQPSTVAAVIGNLQQHTRPGGYNLIVAPALSKDMKCGIDFPFFFAENQLRKFYQQWTIRKYVEAVGAFHRKDVNGNFFQSNFATLIAQKPG